MNNKKRTEPLIEQNNTMWNFVWESVKTDPELILYFLLYLVSVCLPFLGISHVYKIVAHSNTQDTTYFLLGSFVLAVFLCYIASSIFQVALSFSIMERIKGNNPNPFGALRAVFKYLLLIAFVSIMTSVVFFVQITLVLFMKAIFRDSHQNFIALIFKFILFVEGIAATVSAFVFLSHMIPIAIYYDEKNPIKVRGLTLKFIQSYFPERFSIRTGWMKPALIWGTLFFFPMFFVRDQPANSPIVFYYLALVYSIIPLVLLFRAGSHLVCAKLVFLLNDKQEKAVSIPPYFSELGIEFE